MNFKNISPVDLKDIAELQPEGWPEIIPVFQFYINSTFCNPIMVCIDKEIAGIGNSIVFGNTAWLAHIIVKSNFRRKGVGFQIVSNLINELKKKSVNSVSLIATELGESVYKKYGFISVSDYIHLKRVHKWKKVSVTENIVPYADKFFNDVMKLDCFISGELREPLIKQHLKNSYLYLHNKTVKGFYLPELGEGPIYAENVTAGTELMKVKYSKIDNAVFPSENKSASDFLLQHGFEMIGVKGKRMVLGDDIKWNPECFFSRIGGNYG